MSKKRAKPGTVKAKVADLAVGEGFMCITLKQRYVIYSAARRLGITMKAFRSTIKRTK